MNVLSLFDGISVTQQALKELNIIPNYYASEIDKYAMQVTMKNFPKTIQLGDVTKISSKDLPIIELLVGGSPCQDLSIANRNRKGLSGERSGLFYEYVRLRNELKPKYFILENVNSMSKESKEIISEVLGVEPIMINASLVSAQNRKRLFWVGKLNGDKYEQIIIPQPEDKGIMLKDVIESDVDEKYNVNISTIYGTKGLCLPTEKSKTLTSSSYKGYGNDGVTIIDRSELFAPNGKQIILDETSEIQILVERRTELGKQSRAAIRKSSGRDSTLRSADHKAYFGRDGVKSNCITTGLGMEGIIVDKSIFRKLTPIECEKLQSLPINYTEGISNTQRYKCLGNAFNCEVIKHIIKSLRSL